MIGIGSLLYAQDENILNSGFFLSGGYNFSIPVRLSKENYEKNDGFSGRLGFNKNVLLGFFGSSTFLAYEKNRLKLKNNSAQANLDEIYLGEEIVAGVLKYGVGYGGLKFHLPNRTFDDLGKTTLTELKNENNYIQKCVSVWVGAKIPLPFKDSYANRFSLDCDYRFISADRAWMVWHDLLSSLIYAFGFGLADGIVKELFDENKLGTLMTEALVLIGVGAAYWNYDYSHHTWPWHDESPFRIQRMSIYFTYQFARL